MVVLALVVSGLSLVVSVVGVYLANRRAKEAMVESRKAGADAKWSAIQEAVQRLIGFDPSAEPVRERLTSLRIAMIALVDHLDDWDGFGAWLDAERVLGATIGRQVMEAAKGDDAVEQRLANLEPLMTWAQVLSHNLRQFHSGGHDPQALSALQISAVEQIESICARHGWDPPLRESPRIQPLN